MTVTISSDALGRFDLVRGAARFRARRSLSVELLQYDRRIPRPYDEALLRLAFDVARRSRAAGDHPFDSVLADGEGRALMEQGNGYPSEGRDRTAHAERLLASRAARPTTSPSWRGARFTRRPSPARCARVRSTGRGSAASSTVRARRALKAQTGAHEEFRPSTCPAGSCSNPVSARRRS